MKDRGLGCAAITEEQLIDTGTFCPDSEPQGINFNTVCRVQQRKCWIGKPPQPKPLVLRSSSVGKHKCSGGVGKRRICKKEGK